MRNSNLNQNEHTIVRANLRSFLLLTDQWELSRREANILIGLSGLHSIAHWETRPDDVALTEYQAERLSYILSICKMLDTRCKSPAEATKWLRESNPALVFANRTPLSVLSGDGIADLKRVTSWLVSDDKI
ncbi:MAG: DUF2384 domain-containing protein [Pseudomonadales bacterium]|nr:DUF2384 domain-containing protein [Pseudomonadales bacterium]